MKDLVNILPKSCLCGNPLQKGAVIFATINVVFSVFAILFGIGAEIYE